MDEDGPGRGHPFISSYYYYLQKTNKHKKKKNNKKTYIGKLIQIVSECDTMNEMLSSFVRNLLTCMYILIDLMYIQFSHSGPA